MKKSEWIPKKHFKLRGEWAELRFMSRAAEEGLRIIKPWGDSSHYDFVVENGGRFLRVQVKSTSHQRKNSYACALSRASAKRYQSKDIDFFAVYIIPLDTWYIIPFGAVKNVKRGISLSPHNTLTRLAAYKEAWHLLRGEASPRPCDPAQGKPGRTKRD